MGQLTHHGTESRKAAASHQHSGSFLAHRGVGVVKAPDKGREHLTVIDHTLKLTDRVHASRKIRRL
ncbi:hypothetical protein SAMN05444157_3084 [Frankineae bacterium MT45]|nr:hypothetical protein SAMN05444157_3084 [Frankineae bacterium MT45]